MTVLSAAPHSRALLTGRVLLAALLGLGCALAAVGPADPAAATSSGQGWTLAPAPGPSGIPRDAFHLALGAGRSYTGRIVLSNDTLSPKTFEVYATDARNAPATGAFALGLPNQTNHGVGAWTSTTVQTLTVPGLQMASFPFTLAVPSTAAPGDYAGGVVALDTSQQATGGNRVRISVLSGVGVRIYLDVPGPRHPAMAVRNVTAVASVPPFAGLAGSSHSRIRFRLANTGNTIVAPTVRVTVTDGWGRTVKQFVPRTYPGLLPGSALSIVEPLWQALPLAGHQHVEVRVSFPGGTAAGATSFWVVPWGLVAVAGSVVAALVALLVWWWLRRRAVRQAAASVRPKDVPDGISAG
ncbi:MAG: hypothetical protein ACYDES_14385 [Acidimicrobiales bacterium]